jgi:hypothetical protein
LCFLGDDRVIAVLHHSAHAAHDTAPELVLVSVNTTKCLWVLRSLTIEPLSHTFGIVGYLKVQKLGVNWGWPFFTLLCICFSCLLSSQLPLDEQIFWKQRIFEMNTKAKTANTSSPVRIRTKTKARLDELLASANRHHTGRKVKADDIIRHSLGLLAESDLVLIKQSVKTNRDRFEELYRKVSARSNGLSKDAFLGNVLEQIARNF